MTKENVSYAYVQSLMGILRILHKGTQLRNLEKSYPYWETLYYYFEKWGKDGTLERINRGLYKIERKQHGKQETLSLLNIDS